MSNHMVDQAENLRRQLMETQLGEDRLEEVDILNLPPRKEKHKSIKEAKQVNQVDKTPNKKKKKINFPIIQLLLFLFLLLIVLIITSPRWIERV